MKKTIQFLVIVLNIITLSLNAQTMVKDIRSGGYGSRPDRFISMGTTLFFVADTSITGNSRQLWKTDGTSIGTSLVSDKILSNGGVSMGMVTMGGYLYFTAYDGVARELYKTDGTMAGTVMVKDIGSGMYGSNPSELVVYNGNLYFYADDGINGYELWKSDGTTGGTFMVKDIRPGQYGSINTSYQTKLVAMNNMLYFSAWDGGLGNHILWKTDGTANGTVEVKTDGSITYPEDLFEYNGTLYFSAQDVGGIVGRELYKSDGTDAGTILLKDIHTGNYNSSNPNQFTVANNILFFAAYDDAYNFELWKTDGTASGTIKVKEINPSTSGGLIAPVSNLTNCNSNLFFPAKESVNGTELWKSDGTTNGTVLVKDIVPGTGNSDPINLVEMNNILYFSGGIVNNMQVGNIGAELWKSDGTQAGTVLVKDIWPGVYSSSPVGLFNHNGILFFSANDGVHGSELWKYDPNVIGIYENDQNNKNFDLFPNPTNDYLTIKNNTGDINTTYALLNSLGQQILTGKLTGETTRVDVTKLPSGLYFMQVGDEEKQTFKVMKK